MRMTGTKQCAKCKQDKPVLCFPGCSKSADGLYGWCRECVRISASAKVKRQKQRTVEKKANFARVGFLYPGE